MEKTNKLFQAEYPSWKKNLWGAFRAFVGAFIAVMGFMLTTVTVETFESRETLIKFLYALGISGIVGGLIGLGKFIRDIYPDSKIVQRLPI